MEEVYVYDDNYRMQYHPEFHQKHGKNFTEDELEYLCKYYEADDLQTVAFALEKTEAAIQMKVSNLRKTGLFEFYKNRNLYY